MHPLIRRIDALPAEWTENRYAIGTRAIVTKGAHDHRVICATCDAGGTVRHETRSMAFDAACRDSAKPCRACGAS